MNTAAKAIHAERRADFERDYVPLRPRMVRFAASRTHNWFDAEDVVQQTMLVLMLRLDEGKPFGLAPLPFALRQTRNEWVREVRRRTTKGEPRFVPLAEGEAACPNCNGTLQDHRCQLRCERCHCYESCSQSE